MRPWAPTETSPLFFSSSLFSIRRTCAHVVAQTRTVPKRSEAALALEGGMMERKFAAEGSGTGGPSDSSSLRRGRSYLRGRKYLSALFFRIPSRHLLPLFVDLALRSPSRAKMLAATNSG